MAAHVRAVRLIWLIAIAALGSRDETHASAAASPRPAQRAAPSCSARINKCAPRGCNLHQRRYHPIASPISPTHPRTVSLPRFATRALAKYIDGVIRLYDNWTAIYGVGKKDNITRVCSLTLQIPYIYDERRDFIWRKKTGSFIV